MTKKNVEKINKETNPKLKKQPNQNKQKNKPDNKKQEKNNRIKRNIFYLILLVIDIIIIIYSARHNYVNYVTLDNTEPFLLSDKKDLFFGKNYITIITTLFFYIYTLLCNKILFHQKNKKSFTIGLFIFILLLNLILFFIFTKRIY